MHMSLARDISIHGSEIVHEALPWLSGKSIMRVGEGSWQAARQHQRNTAAACRHSSIASLI